MTVVVSRESALKRKVAHNFHPGIGHIHWGEPPMPPGPKAPASVALPPSGTKDGTLHRLAHESGQKVVFSWAGAESAWEPTKAGNRLAFRAEYLAAHGWRYDGKV